MDNNSDDILESVKYMEMKIYNGFLLNDINMKFWLNMQKEWHSGIKSDWSMGGERVFNYFHEINGIKTLIPDFYLQKYSNAFLNY